LLRYYCITCQKPVCMPCAMSRHAQHSLSFLEEAFREKYERLQSLIETKIVAKRQQLDSQVWLYLPSSCCCCACFYRLSFVFCGCRLRF
jgi:hypothetical protein